MSSFNLVHESWIRVLVDGAATEVSLLDALTRAHEIDALELDDALQAVAVFRQVLLPAVLDASGAPRSEAEWGARWEVGRLDADRIRDYLLQHADRFDVFDATVPFAQVAGLRTPSGETKPVSLLLPAVATQNNVPLFSARTDAVPPRLTPPQAVRALLAAHCWDTAAIKSGAVGDPQMKAGKTTGNPTGPLGGFGVTLPISSSLSKTLLLNEPVLRQGLTSGDVPQWRRGPATAAWETRPVTGLLDLLTFQARRIRLVPDVAEDGRVSVSRVVLAAGDRLDHVPQGEIHTMWRSVAKPKEPSGPKPVRHQQGRASWRGLTSMLATAVPTQDGISSTSLLTQLATLQDDGLVPDRLDLQVLSVGVVYGNQSAVVDDVIVDLLPLPVMALNYSGSVHALLLQIVTQAESVRRAANDLGDEIRLAAGGDKLPWDRSLRVGDELMQRMTLPVRRILAGLQREPERIEQAQDAWRDIARRLSMAAGDQALVGAPPQAFLGREQQHGPPRRSSTAEARYRMTVFRLFPPDRESQPVGGQA